jgi:hypothetical protein
MVPDYYARLGVDPGASAAEVEAALQKQQPLWSMGTRNPKTRHTNQLYLDEVPALRRALLSAPESRAAYDAELAAAQIAEREAKLDELQQRIRLRAAKGGLTPADRTLLQDEAARLGLNGDVLDRLTRLVPSLSSAVRVELDDELDIDPPAEVLDPSTRRQIRGALEHLDRRDLYDALGLPRDAPASIIAARADEERQRWMKKAQVTAEKTAWLEIISHAQSHLTAPKARARYDRTLSIEAEEQFEAVSTFALQGLNRLDLGTRQALVEEAAALGIGAERADRLIARACRKGGVSRELGAVAPHGLGMAAAVPSAVGAAAPATNGKYQWIRCRNCSGLTELSPVARRTSPARCRHCGASLKWDCPVCRRSHWMDQPKCTCGFPLALREPLIQHFAAALHAYRSHDLAAAREHLDQVQKYAPHHVGARNGMAKIRQHEADLEYCRNTCAMAIAGKKLMAAKQAVDTWRTLVDPSLPELRQAWKQVSTGLREAGALAVRARQLERVDPPAARALYRKGLEIAADLPEALTGLLRCPPDSPSNLELQVMGDRIRLSWAPPAPDGLGPLTFAVMRKRAELPKHPGDGTRIATVSTCEYDDRHVRPGETVSYAVLSKRGEAESLAAVAVGPVLFLPDVQDVRVDARDGEIDLSWIPPHGVFEVRVVRKAGAPPEHARDGDKIPCALDQALDTDVRQNEAYHYGIFAVYRMPDGQRFPSPGVMVAAFPRAAIDAMPAPRLTMTPGGQVRIEWMEPPRGTVRILRTTRPLPLEPGTRISVEQAEEFGGDWVPPAGSGRAEDAQAPSSVLCYYTPMVTLGGLLTVGHPASLSRVADPLDLRASRTGAAESDGSLSTRVQLRWSWAREATATLLVARQGSPASGPDDPSALVSTVSRAAYERMGWWTLILPATAIGTPVAAGTGPGVEAEPDGPSSQTRVSTRLWFVRAYSVAEVDGTPHVSPGLEPTASTAVPGPHPEVTVSYVFTRPWLPWREWNLTTRTEPPGTPVPPLVVVSNERAVPVSADDGRVIERLPAGRDGSRHVIRAPRNLARSQLRAFVDPALEPDSLHPIRLRHPETGSTRV